MFSGGREDRFSLRLVGSLRLISRNLVVVCLKGEFHWNIEVRLSGLSQET